MSYLGGLGVLAVKPHGFPLEARSWHNPPMARVIKRGEAPGGDITPDTGFADQSPAARSGRVISGEAFTAKGDAQGIRDRAQHEAEQIVTQARAEAERIKKQAYEEAKQKGYADGRDQGAAELSEVV